MSIALSAAACSPPPARDVDVYSAPAGGSIVMTGARAAVSGRVVTVAGAPVAQARVRVALEESSLRGRPCPKKDVDRAFTDRTDDVIRAFTSGLLGANPAERRSVCKGERAARSDGDGRFDVVLPGHAGTAFVHVEVEARNGARAALSIPNRAGDVPQIALIDAPPKAVSRAGSTSFEWSPPSWVSAWGIGLRTASGKPYDFVYGHSFDDRVVEDHPVRATLVVGAKTAPESVLALELPSVRLTRGDRRPPTRGLACHVRFASGEATLRTCPLTDGNLTTRITRDSCTACSGAVRSVRIDLGGLRDLAGVAARRCSECAVRFETSSGRVLDREVTPSDHVVRAGFDEELTDADGSPLPRVRAIVLSRPGPATELSAWW